MAGVEATVRRPRRQDPKFSNPSVIIIIVREVSHESCDNLVQYFNDSSMLMFRFRLFEMNNNNYYGNTSIHGFQNKITN